MIKTTIVYKSIHDENLVFESWVNAQKWINENPTDPRGREFIQILQTEIME